MEPRKHVSDRKLEWVVDVEDMTDVPMETEVFNVFCRLNALQIVVLQEYIRKAMKRAEKRALGKAGE